MFSLDSVASASANVCADNSCAYINNVYMHDVIALRLLRYVWVKQGWDASKRFSHFESHYAYFLGFGVPVTVATYFLSVANNLAVFNALFPLFIITACAAEPVKCNGAASIFGALPDRMPVCGLAQLIFSRTMGGLRKLVDR